jgi:MFS family permease
VTATASNSTDSAIPPATGTGETPFPPAAVGWYATGILAFLYWLSMLDRYIISLLVDPIKRDLGLTDVQFSLLHGITFLGSFTLFGLVFGALADRYNRRRLIYIGVAIWSVGTAACGVAQTYWHLLLARVGVGVGEASLHPNATSMISDLFPRQRLSTAMAIYGLGSTIGAGTAVMIGGVIVEAVARLGGIHVPLIGEIRSWQAVFFIVGVPGTLLALSIFTVPEPVRRDLRSRTQGTGVLDRYIQLFRFVKTRPRFFICHYLGFTLASAVITSGAAWYPAHLARAHHWSAGQIGASLGVAMTAAGILSKLISGWVSDAMYKRGYRDAQMRWYGICLLVALPIGIVATTSGNPWVFVVGIGVFNTLNGGIAVCAMSALNLVTPNELRGSGIAVFNIVMGMLGGSMGPVLVAAISQFGGFEIGVGLTVTIAICFPIGAILLLSGLRAMREAMAEAERPR